MKKRGFTLIELLIVVAIIAILAAIAIPNFLEAQVRSKISRVKTEIRTIATAMESYYIDYKSYPPSWATVDISSDHTGTYVPCLTTPISYISTYPYDIFKVKASGGGGAGGALGSGDTGLGMWPFRYPLYCITAFGVWQTTFVVSGEDIWIPTVAFVCWSWGPDLTSPSIPDPGGVLVDESQGNRGEIRYDPTNGTLSYGDVIWWSGGYNQWDPGHVIQYW